jgi:hypothetical protein
MPVDIASGAVMVVSMVAEAESVAIVVVSVDIIDVESVIVVDSVFFDSQAVARAITEKAKNAEVAKPFMILIVLAVN